MCFYFPCLATYHTSISLVLSLVPSYQHYFSRALPAQNSQSLCSNLESQYYMEEILYPSDVLETIHCSLMFSMQL